MGLRSFLLAVALMLGTTAAVTPAKVVPDVASQDGALPPGVPYAAPADPVRIASILLPAATLHGGDMATAKVLTTSNAAALTARIGNYVMDVPKVAPGTFVLNIRVPRLPLPSYRARVTVTAIAADGRSVHQNVFIKIRY